MDSQCQKGLKNSQILLFFIKGVPFVIVLYQTWNESLKSYWSLLLQKVAGFLVVETSTLSFQTSIGLMQRWKSMRIIILLKELWIFWCDCFGLVFSFFSPFHILNNTHKMGASCPFYYIKRYMNRKGCIILIILVKNYEFTNYSKN